MPAFGTTVAGDIANAALDFYVRGPALLQTQEERPLLAFLNKGKQTFPGGKENISVPVQGDTMHDQVSGFFVGYAEDEELTFGQASNIERAAVPWKEVHAGFVITHTELKQDGIHLVDGETRTSEASGVELTRLTGLLKNRLDDFSESWARAMNEMLWKDGSQDSQQVAGVLSLLVDDPTAGATVASIAQTNTWWRSRSKLDLAPSAENQDISKFLRNEVLQLTRYGGRPNKALCGSDFWDALMQEVQAKGVYTQSGFANKDNDIGLNRISIQGIGTFEYDPTLDTLGFGKRCYVFDSRRLKLRPMQGEENKTYSPSRPYNYMIMLKSMTWTGGLIPNQLNGMAVYGIN